MDMHEEQLIVTKSKKSPPLLITLLDHKFSDMVYETFNFQGLSSGDNITSLLISACKTRDDLCISVAWIFNFIVSSLPRAVTFSICVTCETYYAIIHHFNKAIRMGFCLTVTALLHNTFELARLL